MKNIGKREKKHLLTLLGKRRDASGSMVQKDATRGKEILLFESAKQKNFLMEIEQQMYVKKERILESYLGAYRMHNAN